MLNIDKIINKLHTITADDLCTDDYSALLHEAAIVSGFKCSEICPYYDANITMTTDKGYVVHCPEGSICKEGTKAWALAEEEQK